MELRGEIAGVQVYDDFAHHPTAIETTLEGARLAFGDARIWAIFEPRSWSSRRNVFQDQFARSFGHADFAIIAGVFESEKLPPEVRLNPGKLVADISANGTPARYLANQQELLGYVLSNVKGGDKLILMSNGSFDGLHEKLLDRLR